MNKNPLPTLEPGDSHMESLIAAAIQGHADTRDAMRWLVRQLVPATQPADVTDEREAFEACEVMAGSLFKRRADDPEKYWDGNVQDDWELWQARAILALRPVQVPMKQDEVIAAIKSANISSSTTFWSIFEAGIRAAEAHHGISAQAKKETP